MLTSISQRWRDRRGSYRPAGEPIQTRDYDVAVIGTDRVARRFVETHHYSGSYPAARWRFGLYRRCHLVGVAVFSQPVNNLSLRPLPGAPTDSVELGRFVLLDDVAGNGETWFLARCFEKLREAGVVGVVSFSDPMARSSAAGRVVFGGHVGTIYQAFNAVYLGRARSDWLRLLPDGTVLHNRALAKVRKGEKGWRYVVESLRQQGAPALVGDRAEWVERVVAQLTRRVRHPGNHKYVWAIDKRVRRSLPASIVYLDASGGITTRHPEAMLHDTREAAEAAAAKSDAQLPPNLRETHGSLVEEIEDEPEFRSREDTW